MRPEFLPHNLFMKGIDHFLENDPHLSYLNSLKYVLEPELLKEIPLHVPGIYILTGARQVGKSTLLKLLIKHLLVDKTCAPDQIFYLPCDIVLSFRELITEIERFFSRCLPGKPFYVFIDEVTYVKDWDRVIKHFADLGYFQQGSTLITGSDSTILRAGMKRFPGRRGTAPQTDFHYYPLSFSEYTRLVEPLLWQDVEPVHEAGSRFIQEPVEKNMKGIASVFPTDQMEELVSLFNRYLITGGFLTATNELGMQGTLGRYIYNTYIHWILGDFLKQNKNENSLKEIVLAVSDRLGKQVSFQSITAATSIQNHSTVREYLQILENMDVLVVMDALREDKLMAAPKKAKKLHFTDPFIATGLICWSKDIYEYWDFVRKELIPETFLKADVVEGVIASLFKRRYKSFYIKAENEVDLSIITGKSFFPIEIKNSSSLKRNDLKQVLKYKQGIIGYRGMQMGKFEHLDVLPLSILALFV